MFQQWRRDAASIRGAGGLHTDANEWLADKLDFRKIVVYSS
jgi:hypothetical protein